MSGGILAIASSEGEIAVPPVLPHQMTITWTVTSLTISDQGLEAPRCRACQSGLNVHQPDEDHPEHLLGTCDDCGAWYLIEVDANGTEAFLYDLPNVTMIHL